MVVELYLFLRLEVLFVWNADNNYDQRFGKNSPVIVRIHNSHSWKRENVGTMIIDP